MTAMEAPSLVEASDLSPTPHEPSPEELLYEAVRKNQLDAAATLAKVAKVDHSGSTCVTPLYVAMDNQNIAMTRMLLENGAGVNRLSYCHKYCTYETPIVTAARLQNQDLVDLLLAYDECTLTETTNQKTALQWAASTGNVAMAEAFLARGADINSVGMFLHTALHYAAIADKPDMVRWLLDNGAEIDVNGEGRTPLHIACVRGNLKIVEHLTTQRTCRLDSKDFSQFTPLSLASLRGHQRVVEYFLGNFSVTAELLNESLHKATEGGHLSVIHQLLAAGADVNSTNASGENLLVVAAKSQYVTTETFLSRGANINAVDNRGYSPLQHALIRDQRDIAALLIQHGALLNTSTTTDSQLRLAFNMSNAILVKFILQAGCHLTQESWFQPALIRERIQEADFQIPGSLRFSPDSSRQKQAWQWVLATFGRTRSLLQLSRIAIREQLVVATAGASILASIEQLPLPSALKGYLTLTDISNE